MSNEFKQNGEKAVCRVPFCLRLRSIKATRQTFVRIIREYGRGVLDERTYKSLIYGLAQYSGLLKLELESDIEKRLEIIENKIEELK